MGGGEVTEGVSLWVVSGTVTISLGPKAEGVAVAVASQCWGMGALAGKGDLSGELHNTMMSPFGR